MVLTLCPLRDAKSMILDGYNPIVYTGSHVLMKKEGTDVLINGVSENVWNKNHRDMIIKYRFTVYDNT